jgi:hypothetical protein
VGCEGEAAVISVWLVIGLASWLAFNLAVFILLYARSRPAMPKPSTLVQSPWALRFIGQTLRERYALPHEVPPDMRRLLTQLDEPRTGVQTSQLHQRTERAVNDNSKAQ